jgi:hypothetical protein
MTHSLMGQRQSVVHATLRCPTHLSSASPPPLSCLLCSGSIIMLHGLGDSGDGWAPVGAEWAPDLKHVKFIFPHAPNVSIALPYHAWPTRSPPNSLQPLVCTTRHHEAALLRDLEDDTYLRIHAALSCAVRTIHRQCSALPAANHRLTLPALFDLAASQ